MDPIPIPGSAHYDRRGDEISCRRGLTRYLGTGRILLLPMTHTLRIGRVAEEAGVSVQTLRYYERRGLIEKPPTSAAGYRSYPPGSVEEVRFIKRAQGLGFTLDEVASLIALRVAGRRRRQDVRTVAQQRLRSVERKLADLQSIRDALARLVQECVCRDEGADCPILGALDGTVERVQVHRAPRRPDTHDRRE